MPRPRAGELTSIRWYGGKSASAGRSTGRWIAGLLPYDYTYAEPFAGMLGVLLQRRPSPSEIVNDVDGRIVNWWRTVRDRTAEFAEYMALTQERSRDEYVWACEHVDDGGVVGAAAFTIMLISSFRPTGANTGYRFTARNVTRCLPDRIWGLADRLREVQIENLDANDFIERVTASMVARPPRGAVMYVDPPYRTQGGERYVSSQVDWDRLTGLLAGFPHMVAVSGYNNEWDHLGWYRNEFSTNTTMSGQPEPRIEVLWTNWKPERMLF